MRVLLDTRIAVWWLDGHARLSLEARSLVDQASEAFVSQASLWDIALRQAAGRMRIDLPGFVKEVEETGFRWLDVRPEHLFALSRLPVAADHSNPFERMLVAQSMSEPLILLTPNRAMERFGATIRVV